MRFLIFISVWFVSTHCVAGVFAEFNGYLATDSFTTTGSATTSRSFYALDIYANLEKKNRIFAGFHVDQISFSDGDGTTTRTLTGMNMGPMFLVAINKDQTYTLSAGYLLKATGAYNNGATSSDLTGTGMFAVLSMMPEFAENWFGGLKLNYYSLSYTKSSVGTTAEDVSYTRTLMFPSIGLAWRY